MPIYMDINYSEKEWRRIMRPTHYQYKWCNPKSSKASRDGSKPPPGVKGITREMRALVDLAIRDSR